MKFFPLLILLLASSALASQIKISMDNDLFSSNNDQDYTASSSIVYITDNFQLKSEKLELGLVMFTPNNIQSSQIQLNDRPYSSLIYTSYTKSENKINKITSHSFSIGILGLHLPGKIQNFIHKNIGSPKVNGWKHQISNKGELTGLYSFINTFSYRPLKYQKYININYGYGASLGYFTQLNTQVNFRIGYFKSFFSESGLNNGNIASENTVPIGKKFRDYYAYFGLQPKLSIYNSFLQGQFRNSPHTISSKKLKNFIIEAWIGTHISLTKKLYLDIVYKYQTKETKIAKRDFNWGNFSINYLF